MEFRVLVDGKPKSGWLDASEWHPNEICSLFNGWLKLINKENNWQLEYR